jgi:hypothetical protein
MLGVGRGRTNRVNRQPVCHGCLLHPTCVYATIVESPTVGGDLGGRYARRLHRFVLDRVLSLVGSRSDARPPTRRSTGPGKGDGRFRGAAMERAAIQPRKNGTMPRPDGRPIMREVRTRRAFSALLSLVLS